MLLIQTFGRGVALKRSATVVNTVSFLPVCSLPQYQRPGLIQTLLFPARSSYENETVGGLR